jgi:hypothetical protein
VHYIDSHNHEMEYSFAEWKHLFIECHTPHVCAWRRDYTCKFSCDRKSIHKIRLNNHRWRGCPLYIDGNGVPIRKKDIPSQQGACPGEEKAISG